VAVGIGSEGAAGGDNGVASGGGTAFGDGRRPRHSQQRQQASGRQQAMAEPTGRDYWQRRHGRRRLVAVAAAQPVAAADAQPGTVCHSGDRRRRRGATAPAVAVRDGALATGSDGTPLLKIPRNGLSGFWLLIGQHERVLAFEVFRTVAHRRQWREAGVDIPHRATGV